jgi:hypothetical protein
VPVEAIPKTGLLFIAKFIPAPVGVFKNNPQNIFNNIIIAIHLLEQKNKDVSQKIKIHILTWNGSKNEHDTYYKFYNIYKNKLSSRLYNHIIKLIDPKLSNVIDYYDGHKPNIFEWSYNYYNILNNSDNINKKIAENSLIIPNFGSKSVDYSILTTVKSEIMAKIYADIISKLPVKKLSFIKYSYDDTKANKYTIAFQTKLKCKIQVVNSDVIDLTELLYNEHNNTKKIGILNLANPETPGGGVLSGSFAQEEEIFRRTNIHLKLGLNNYSEVSKFWGVCLHVRGICIV